MFDTTWKKRGVIFGFWSLLILIFSLSNPFGLGFITIFPLLIMIPGAIFTYLVTKDPDVVEDGEVEHLQGVITDFEKIVEEQIQVIKDYEEIFDTQLVELPCICGGNTFKGLFSPNTDNVVECEKCHEKYKVNIQYDTVLISQPMNLNETFDKLVGDTN